MALSISSAFLGRRGTRAISTFLESLEFSHFGAVTHTVTYKQLEIIVLLVLVVITWVSDLVYCQDSIVAIQGLRSECRCQGNELPFSGLTPILGVIQLLELNGVSESVDQSFHQAMGGQFGRKSWQEEAASKKWRERELTLGRVDKQWVQMNSKL